MNFLGLSQNNRIHNCSNNILNLVIANNASSIYSSPDILLPIDLFHPALLISFIITLSANAGIVRNEIFSNKKLNFARCNLTSLNTLLHETDWPFLTKSTDINLVVNLFY